jgi:PKD repeat protein
MCLSAIFISCSTEDGSIQNPKIEPPEVNFNISVTSGIEPLLVEFENLSNGNNLKYLWDFGDGETSTEINPQHIYDSIGVFQVKLVATDVDEQTGASEKEIQVSSRISSDEAIRNIDLPLVLFSKMLYSNIKPRTIVKEGCRVERLKDPILDIWDSWSKCERVYDPSNGQMKAYTYAGAAQSNCYNNCLIPGFKEQTTVTYSMIREFSVAGDTIDGKIIEKDLAGSIISFNLRWLGRLVSGGPGGISSSKIEFYFIDTTEGQEKEYEKFDDSSITGQWKLVTVKGVPLPLPIPGWQKNEVEDNLFVTNLALTTGHSYHIRIDLTLETRSDVFALLQHSWTDFKNRGIFNKEEGFIRWSDIVIDVGT